MKLTSVTNLNVHVYVQMFLKLVLTNLSRVSHLLQKIEKLLYNFPF